MMSSDPGPVQVVAGETITASSASGGGAPVSQQPARASTRPGTRRRDEPRREPVQRITDASSSHSEQIARRMRTYAVSMGIRTLCVAAFVLLFPHWSAWLMVPGAALLPYVAVLLANAGREARPSALPRLTPRPDAGRQELGGARPTGGGPGTDGAPGPDTAGPR